MECQKIEWFDLGNGIEILRHDPGWDPTKSQSENLKAICSNDLLSLKVTEPEKYVVAVDTTTKVQPLGNAGEKIILTSRVGWVYPYQNDYTVQLTCFDPERIRWYTMMLTLHYSAPYAPELKITALLTPPSEIESSEEGFKAALKRCVDGLSQTT